MMTNNSMRDFDQNKFSSLDATWPRAHRQDFLKPLVLGLEVPRNAHFQRKLKIH